MASNHNQSGPDGHGGQGGGSAAQRRAAVWADGLKQLDDSVVEEVLPDRVKDLLDRLDGLGDGGPSPGSNANGGPASGGQGPRA